MTADSLGWETLAVALPLADHLDEQEQLAKLKSESEKTNGRIYTAKRLSLIRRTNAGVKVDIGCLRLGDTRVLHMPGELFVEYQLNAATLRPDLFVAMAAYGRLRLRVHRHRDQLHTRWVRDKSAGIASCAGC